MIQRIPITSREQWLGLRARDVTASVIGALRGLHPFSSRLKLFKQHSGFDMPVKENVRMRRGTLLEYAVAASTGWLEGMEIFMPQQRPPVRPDWKITPAGVYLRDPSLRLGATPDFWITDERGRKGVLQTKLTNPATFDREWRDDLGELMPPMWIRLQALTEAMLHDAEFGAISVMMDATYRDDCHVFEFDRHPEAEAAIRADVEQFWQDVEWGIEPDANGSVDSELVKLLYPKSNEEIQLDLTGDNYLTDALAERVRLKEQIKSLAGRVEEIETELRGKMGEAVMARFNGFVVTLRTIERTGYTVPPTSYRKLNVSDLRPKEIMDDGKPARF